MKTLNGLVLLFIDDDTYNIKPVIEMLKYSGVEVIMATTGTEAINILVNKGKKIDIIILDIMMPPGTQLINLDNGKTTGVSLFQIIKNEMNMITPIIISSVVTDEKILRNFPNDERTYILSKPYSYNQLSQIIMNLIKTIN